MEAGAGTLGRRRFGPGRIAAVAVAAVLLGIGAGVALHLRRASTAPASTAIVTERHGMLGQATWAAGTKAAPPITTLVDQTGHRFSLSSLRGRTVALVFFDSHCNQECPLEGRELAAAEQSLPAAQRPVLVAVSVNPLDTPASARKAARAWGLAGAAPWHWLMGGRAALAPVWRAYHIYVGHSADGDIPHTEALILIDGGGYERSGYLYPFNQRFVTHDLTVLAHGARS
jgi:cytochrome oxidase Cu insertion factor (SCO1/SenC/PrrC family)